MLMWHVEESHLKQWWSEPLVPVPTPLPRLIIALSSSQIWPLVAPQMEGCGERYGISIQRGCSRKRAEDVRVSLLQFYVSVSVHIPSSFYRNHKISHERPTGLKTSPKKTLWSGCWLMEMLSERCWTCTFIMFLFMRGFLAWQQLMVEHLTVKFYAAAFHIWVSFYCVLSPRRGH